MNGVLISVVVTVAGFFVSVGASAFISGMRWGQMTTAVTSIDSRLAKIEGMFVMVPIQPPTVPGQPPHFGA